MSEEIKQALSSSPIRSSALFEQAIIDLLDYFALGGISQATRLKLIYSVLKDNWLIDQRFTIENRMRAAQGLARIAPAVYRPGVSQLFFFCYHIITDYKIKDGLKLIKIRNAINESGLFPYEGADDFTSSRRTLTKVDFIDLDEIDPMVPETGPYTPV